MINLFSKVYETTPVDELDICDIENLIRDNPLKDQILQIHELQVKSDRYNEIKKELPCITPHGTFYGNKKDANIKHFSGYLYFDHDVYNTTCSVEEYSAYIVKNHQEHIALHGRSVGNRGLFTYIRIENKEVITKQNFKTIYSYVRNEVLGDITAIDSKAGGISIYQFIPYDKYLYSNSGSIYVPSDIYNSINYPYIENLSKQGSTIEVKIDKDDIQSTSFKQPKGIRTDVVSFIPTPLRILLRTYHHKTPVEVTDPLYVEKPVPFVEICFPRVIKDGKKHPTYHMITNIFVYLNPGICLHDVQSYIYWLNVKYTANKRMELRELLNTVEDTYYTSLQTGLWITPKIKWVHFNPNCGLTAEEKRSMASSINGKRRKRETSEKIKMAIGILKDQNEPITQKNIAKLAGISVRNLQRYEDIIEAAKHSSAL